MELVDIGANPDHESFDICDERRGLHLREIIARVPLDRLMIETDAPYLLKTGQFCLLPTRDKTLS